MSESHDVKLWNQFASSVIRTRECWTELQNYIRSKGGPDYANEEVQVKLARCSWRSPFHKMIGRLVDYATTSGGLDNLLVVSRKEK